MSIASLASVPASAAGVSLAQTAGSDVERTLQSVADHERRVAAIAQAESAAGVAETDGKDLQPHDRDGDGRRPWVFDPRTGRASVPAPITPLASDNDENRGAHLDLTG